MRASMPNELAHSTSTATGSAPLASADALVYEETDHGFYVGVGQTQSVLLRHHRRP